MDTRPSWASQPYFSQREGASDISPSCLGLCWARWDEPAFCGLTALSGTRQSQAPLWSPFLAWCGYPQETAQQIVPLGLHMLHLPSQDGNREIQNPRAQQSSRGMQIHPKGVSSSQRSDAAFVQALMWISVFSWLLKFFFPLSNSDEKCIWGK